MGKLSKKARAKLPAKKFAGPGRSYPVNDVEHAEKAIQLAPRGVKAGHISAMQEAMIDKKARAVIAKAKKGK